MGNQDQNIYNLLKDGMPPWEVDTVAGWARKAKDWKELLQPYAERY